MKRPEQHLANYLKLHGLTIGFVESITCGLLTHKLGTISGTSEILRGSIICYSEKVKIGLLGIKISLLNKHTAESQIVTDEMAKKLKRLVKADIHAAITGLAAPGGSETKKKPVGSVFFSFIFRNKKYKMKKRFYGSPLRIKEKACSYFFKYILKKIKEVV